MPDWHVDVRAHCVALVAVLRSALARHVSLRVAHRTPSATEPAILATVTLRRSVRPMGRTLGRTRQLVVLHNLLSTWAALSKPSAALSHIRAMYGDLGLQLLQLQGHFSAMFKNLTWSSSALGGSWAQQCCSTACSACAGGRAFQ